MRFNHCVSQKTEPWPWQLNPKEVAGQVFIRMDSICCKDDQICFAASVALKTFVQFQFRFQSLTSRSLTGTLGFNLVKCWSRFHNENDHFTKTQGPQMEKFTKNHQKVTPKSSAQNLPFGPCSSVSSWVQCWNRSYKQLVLRWLCSMWCDFLWDLFQIALNCYVVCICLLLKNSDVALGSMYQDPHYFCISEAMCCQWSTQRCYEPPQRRNTWCHLWQVIGVSGLQAPKIAIRLSSTISPARKMGKTFSCLVNHPLQVTVTTRIISFLVGKSL